MVSNFMRKGTIPHEAPQRNERPLKNRKILGTPDIGNFGAYYPAEL
jgi:hypothetical protein